MNTDSSIGIICCMALSLASAFLWDGDWEAFAGAALVIAVLAK